MPRLVVARAPANVTMTEREGLIITSQSTGVWVSDWATVSGKPHRVGVFKLHSGRNLIEREQPLIRQGACGFHTSSKHRQRAGQYFRAFEGLRVM